MCHTAWCHEQLRPHTTWFLVQLRPHICTVQASRCLMLFTAQASPWMVQCTALASNCMLSWSSRLKMPNITYSSVLARLVPCTNQTSHCSSHAHNKTHSTWCHAPLRLDIAQCPSLSGFKLPGVMHSSNLELPDAMDKSSLILKGVVPSSRLTPFWPHHEKCCAQFWLKQSVVM
jgi:hypothetical protein